MSLRILGFGLTGRTGQHFVPMALEKGHRVIAFVRNPKKVPAKWTENKNFTAIRADPPTTAVVQEAIAAHDPHVILSMLSSDQKPHNAVSGAARTTIEALAALNAAREEKKEEKKIPHYVFIAGRGIGDTNKTLSKFERALIWPFLTLWGESFKDQQLGYKMLGESALATHYTSIDPPLLTEDAFTGRYRAGEPKSDPDMSVWHKIGRPDMAHACLSIAEAAAAGAPVPKDLLVRAGDKSTPKHPGFMPQSDAGSGSGSGSGASSAGGAGAAGEAKRESKSS